MLGNWWMLKNGADERDSLLTFSAGAVLVVLFRMAFQGMSIRGWVVPAISDTTIEAILTPILAAYTAKRIGVAYVDSKTPPPPQVTP